MFYPFTTCWITYARVSDEDHHVSTVIRRREDLRLLQGTEVAVSGRVKEFRKHEKGKQLQLVGVDRLMIRHFSPKFRSVGALTRIEMFEITQTGETECVSVAHFVRVESTD